MAFEDFIRYFSEVVVLRCDDRFKYAPLLSRAASVHHALTCAHCWPTSRYSWLRLPHLSPGTLCGVEVEFSRKTKGCFEMHQPSRRNYPGKTISNYKYRGIHYKARHFGAPSRVHWYRFTGDVRAYVSLCSLSANRSSR